MNSIIYVIASIIEGFSIFFFAFGLFRVSIREYWREVVLTTLIISLTTYFYKDHALLSSISPVLNILLMIFFLFILFKLPLLHSVYIVVTSFVVMLAVQGLSVAIVNLVFHVGLAYIREIDLLRYTFQLSTDFVIFLVSLILRRFNIWFTFVPYHRTIRFKVSTINLSLLVSSLIGIAIMFSAFRIDNIVAGSIFWIIYSLCLLLVGYKKEFGKNE